MEIPSEQLILDAIRRSVAEVRTDLYFHDRDAIAKTALTRLREEGFALVPATADRDARVAELQATLRTVRAAIIEKAECTFWLTPIETVVDHIDAVLGGFAADQTEMAI